MKFGFQLVYLRSIQASANANARGAFNFNGMFTAQTNCRAAATPPTIVIRAEPEAIPSPISCWAI